LYSRLNALGIGSPEVPCHHTVEGGTSPTEQLEVPYHRGVTKDTIIATEEAIIVATEAIIATGIAIIAKGEIDRHQDTLPI
jgi:hypothetical protein